MRPLYVSAFEVHLDLPGSFTPIDDIRDLIDPRHGPRRRPPPPLGLPAAGVALLRRLRGAGIPFTLFHDFWKSSVIMGEIERSAGLLALVDRHYTSSTNRLNDFCHAVGYSRTNLDGHLEPRPVFIFPIDVDQALHIPEMFPDSEITILSEAPEVAAEELRARLTSAP